MKKHSVTIDRAKLIEAVGGSVPTANYLIEQHDLFQKHRLRYNSAAMCAEKSKRMLAAQRNGHRMSSKLPYGWKSDPDDPKRMLADKKERLAITWAVKMRKHGKFYTEIAAELSHAGLHPRPAKDGSLRKWAPATIALLINRELEKIALSETEKGHR